MRCNTCYNQHSAPSVDAKAGGGCSRLEECPWMNRNGHTREQGSVDPSSRRRVQYGIVPATMRHAFRAVLVVCLLVVARLVTNELGTAQARVVPMPPNLFSTQKLNDHLYVIMPSGPDTSNVGGNVGVCVSDQGVLLVDANYYFDWRN